MNGGQLISNNRSYSVTIQKLVEAEKDENGFEGEEEWYDYYTNHAYINNLSGNERWMAAQVQMDQSVRFTFRWHKALDDVKPKYHRILWNNRIFNITNVDNVMYANETVKIDAVEVEP